MKNSHKKLLGLLLAVGLVGAACGSDDPVTDTGDTTATTEAGSESADTTAATDEESDTTAAEDESAAGAVDLSGDCPSPLVIQTDWFPESEHGALYEMVGEGYAVDKEAKTVTGPLWAGGEETGIEVEVRSGGPAIGFAAPRVQMYTDDSIHLGYTSTDNQVTAWGEAPLVAVVAPLEKNPQMIMWDPATYPDVKTIADLGAEGVTVNVFAGGGFSDYFVAAGTWDADQVDPSYDGSPARFIAEAGKIAQQGFASAEPYNYENVFEEWAKPVAFELVHDAGFQIYSQAIGVKPDQLEDLRPCLEKVVPVIQQAAVDYITNPDRANAIIIDTVATFEDFWVYDQGVADFAVGKQLELGLVGNGPDDTLGNMEEERFATIIEQIDLVGLDYPEDLTAAEMFTNEFIDETIGL
jgi:hypothetical protein